ncbi:MAG: polysaccharide biosynthesis/export family protein [Bacteroidales bacterium]|nr:polysaccharide biosynthesis/export family protein [Bacteroidales bacterium]
MLAPNEMFRTPADYKFSEFKTTETQEYRLKPYDKLDIKIFYNNGSQLIEFNQTQQGTQGIEYDIEYDGKVKLPIIGRINLSNLTIRQAEDTLQKIYSRYILEPFVKIRVTNKKVIVFNSGASSGKIINFTNENISLIEALAEAGGISDFSKSYKIKLIRGSLNNPQIYIFNLNNINQMKNANFNLEPNDIIYVERRPLWATRMLNEITPYLNLLTTAILIYTIFIK